MADGFSSQGSDLFPEEVKHCIYDPDIQDVINCVQIQDPFLVAVPNDELYVLQAPTPSPTCTMLCTEDYSGPYEFEIQVNGENSGKSWQFSYDLNKLFINMGTTIHLSFKCNSFPPNLYIRAISVFSKSNDFRDPVIRCLHHITPDNKHNEGVAENVFEHVIRIVDPHAIYECDEFSKRYSVRVLLDSPQPGSDYVTIPFMFVCKNSCISGMNRRATEVIFTLESANSFVFGRQKMRVRICSCPKRDKTKEELDFSSKNPETIPTGKRLMHQNISEFPSAKQRKIDDSLFQIPVLHLEEYVYGLDCMKFRLCGRLKIENRAPTEKETQLLNEYDQLLKTYKKRAT